MGWAPKNQLRSPDVTFTLFDCYFTIVLRRFIDSVLHTDIRIPTFTRSEELNFLMVKGFLAKSLGDGNVLVITIFQLFSEYATGSFSLNTNFQIDVQ